MTALILLALLAANPTPPAQASPRPLPAASLELRELLEARGASFDVSRRVRELAGTRVRVRGWLVVFEEPLADAFWVAPQPVFQDESGAGSGDLSPLAIRVSAPREVLQALPLDAAPLEVVGRLEHGRRVDGEGRASIVRLVVEDPRDVLRLTRAAPVEAPKR